MAFTLGLLEACSLKFTVPMIILRTLLGHLSESGETVLQGHLAQASAVLPNIRTEMAHEFVRVFKLTLPEDYFYELASQEMDSGRYAEAAVCIVNGDLFERFNCLDLCLNLVDVNRIAELKLVLSNRESLRVPVVNQLSTPKHAKTATKLVVDYGLDP